ncbi:hypothetical protein MKEN_00042400 [Mycena kentingensis (nom. inval.)]|nr:hypothetical protein MKEN_00042400 [Mycena kentingensis (nom. inval.)]
MTIYYDPTASKREAPPGYIRPPYVALGNISCTLVSASMAYWLADIPWPFALFAALFKFFCFGVVACAPSMSPNSLSEVEAFRSTFFTVAIGGSMMQFMVHRRLDTLKAATFWGVIACDLVAWQLAMHCGRIGGKVEDADSSHLMDSAVP